MSLKGADFETCHFVRISPKRHPPPKRQSFQKDARGSMRVGVKEDKEKKQGWEIWLGPQRLWPVWPWTQSPPSPHQLTLSPQLLWLGSPCRA